MCYQSDSVVGGRGCCVKAKEAHFSLFYWQSHRKITDTVGKRLNIGLALLFSLTFFFSTYSYIHTDVLDENVQNLTLPRRENIKEQCFVKGNVIFLWSHSCREE